MATTARSSTAKPLLFDSVSLMARPGRGHQQRVAVGRSLRCRGGADISSASRAVLDDDALAQAFVELAADEPGHAVGEAAGREGHDERNRTTGIVLRSSARGTHGNDDRCDNANRSIAQVSEHCGSTSPGSRLLGDGLRGGRGRTRTGTPGFPEADFKSEGTGLVKPLWSHDIPDGSVKTQCKSAKPVDGSRHITVGQHHCMSVVT
jgi:hypothetical protein